MNRLVYIERLVITVLLLLLLALAPARAQIPMNYTIVYVGETTTLSVDSVPYETYKWDLYNDSTVNFAVVDGTAVADGVADFVNGDTVGESVQLKWNTAGIYFWKVTGYDVSGCTNNLRMGIIRVLENPPTATLVMEPDSVCIGEWAELEITFTGTAPWRFTLQMEDPLGNLSYQDYTGITDAQNPMLVAVNPVVTTKYTVIDLVDLYSAQRDPSNTVELTIHPLPVSSPIYLKTP